MDEVKGQATRRSGAGAVKGGIWWPQLARAWAQRGLKGQPASPTAETIDPGISVKAPLR
ncbi:hypothetical protein D3C86_2183340 [compost metagenome]